MSVSETADNNKSVTTDPNTLPVANTTPTMNSTVDQPQIHVEIYADDEGLHKMDNKRKHEESDVGDGDGGQGGVDDDTNGDEAVDEEVSGEEDDDDADSKNDDDSKMDDSKLKKARIPSRSKEEKAAEDWALMVEALNAFCEKHGHCNVPFFYETTLSNGKKSQLGFWLGTQRKYKKQGKLPAGIRLPLPMSKISITSLNNFSLNFT